MAFPERAFRPESRLETLLTAWGSSQALDGEHLAPAVHPIAKAMQFGRKGKDSRGTLGRAGQAIRLLTKSPSWGTKPVPCHETRSVRADYAPAVLSDSAMVESAVQELAEKRPKEAEALRLRYCASGTPTGKARKLGMTLNQYRDTVASGRQWIGWRLNA